MSDERAETAKWDPGFTRQITNWVGPIIRRYFRAEVRDIDFDAGRRWRAGGVQPLRRNVHPDVLVFAPAFYEKFGFDRPLYTLAHYGVLIGPLGDLLRKAGVIEASRENAAKALRSRCGRAGVPGRRLRLVPADHDRERGRLRRAHRLCPDRASRPACRSCRWCPSARRRPSCSSPGAIRSPAGSVSPSARMEILPVSVGFPFGLSRDLPAQSAAAVQDRHPGARADRHRRAVRRRSRRRRGRPPRPRR